MILLSGLDMTLPLNSPVLKFLIILLIILFTPILLNKLKIPHILGLIVAGAFIGPNGFNLILRDNGIIMSGTAGLLYIMFLAGLEIDLADFKKNSKKGALFGAYTFIIPMVLGILAGLYLLNMSMLSAILLASMFASHTLIAYPILSKLGVTKNRAVNIAVGGTMITDTLSLLVLAVIVGMSAGEVNAQFWTRLTLSIIAFGLVVLFVFPIIGRWFLKQYQDTVAQYVFILAMVFLGAALAELAGIEAIIGAFLTGLALNPLIPHHSSLMHRIEFVGTSIFIPFFLIGVGMLVDYRVFFKGFETIKVAAIMTIVATIAKFLAAWLTQKSLKFTADERRLIFGLSNAQAAATLAAVLVGYNVGLLDESILNGTIVMILVTCTIATFVAQKGAENISLAESVNLDNMETDDDEKILIPINHIEKVDELINLSAIIKAKDNVKGLYILNIINNESSTNDEATKKAKKVFEKAEIKGAHMDIQINKLLRYDLNIVNGMTGVIKEHEITDMVLGIDKEKGLSESFLSKLTDGVLGKCNTTTFIYKSLQPIETLKRHIVVVPDNAENEIGFPFWLSKVWNISRNTGAKIVFYASEKTTKIIQDIHTNYPINAEFQSFEDWSEFLIIARDIKPDDNLIVILSRKNKTSYHETMAEIPSYLNKFFTSNSYILIYPMQIRVADTETMDLNNASLLEPIEKLDELGKTIAKLFIRK